MRCQDWEVFFEPESKLFIPNGVQSKPRKNASLISRSASAWLLTIFPKSRACQSQARISPLIQSTLSVYHLSPPQRPLCVVGRLGRKKKKARGARWKEEREKRSLSLFPSSPSNFLHFDYSIAIFIGIPSGSLCGGESSNTGGGTKSPSYRDSTERSKGKQGLNLGVRFSEVSVLYGGVR